MMFKVIAGVSLFSCSAHRMVTEDDNSLDVFKEEEVMGQCPKTIAEVDEPLQTYFDRQRVQLGLLQQSELDDHGFDLSTGSTETCTKRDVCLLMRQLDMDFYKRARAGTLTDMDFDTPPELAWMHKGNCASAVKTRGKRFKTVMDAEKCKKAMRKTGFFGEGAWPQEISNNNIPAGCVIEVNNKARGGAKAFLNVLENSTATAGPKREYRGRSSLATKDANVQVLCEMDRSLSEAAATYYSPYKLKQSMVSRPQMSTSCSFGMYAYLAKLKETKSSCAKLLTAQTSGRFHSAQDALDQAAAAEKAEKYELASEIRRYVEDVRSKFVLIDTIANKWCPGVWEAAQESPQGTCDVPRKSSWSDEGAAASDMVEPRAKKPSRRPKRSKGGRMGQVQGGPAKAANADRLKNIHNMLDELDDAVAELLAGEPMEKKAKMRSSDGKPHKMALSESICSEVEDQTLASILQGVPTTPPDFFRDAHVPEGDEHPSLSPSENQKYIRN